MRILKADDSPVCCVAWASGREVVSGTRNGTITVWDVLTGEIRRTLPLVCRIPYRFHLALSPDGQVLVAGGQHLALTFRDFATTKSMPVLPVETQGVFGIAYSPNGRTFAIVPMREEDRLHYLRRWDMVKGKELLPPLMSHGSTIDSPAFAPDGTTLAVYVHDRTIRLFDFKTGEQTACWPSRSEVTGLAWLPVGKTLALTRSRGVTFWDVNRGKELARLKGHSRRIKGVSVCPGRQVMATASDDGTVRLWDTATGACQTTFEWGIGAIGAVAIAPDGLTAIAGGERGELVIWDLEPSNS